MTLWLDTSALVSLYVPEPRSERVARLVRGVGEPILFSPLHELETVAALRLRVFRREVLQKMVDATIDRLREDIQEGILHRAAVDWPLTLAKAGDLANQHSARLGCRSLDVLHVAAAVTCGCRRFVTADRRQSQLARRTGLATTRLS